MESGAQNLDLPLEEWLSQIRRNQKIKSEKETELEEIRKELADIELRVKANPLSEHDGEELKRQKQECESRIKDGESHINSFRNLVAQSTKKLVAKIMRNTAEYFQIQSLVVGGAGAGKSHVVALAIKDEVPSVRCSTPCCMAAPFTMKQVQLGEKGASIEACSDTEYTEMLLKSRESNTKMSTLDKTSASLYSENVSVGIADKVFVDLYRKQKSLELASGIILGKITDTGGLPQLMDLLPRFICDTQLCIIVTDLSQNFADYPICHWYERGEPVGEGFQSNFTNEQMVGMYLHMAVSKSKKVKVMFVGTHREQESSSKETRSFKETKIQEMVATFGLKGNVVYTDKSCKNVIFEVNALVPEKRDIEVGQKIVEEMLNGNIAEPMAVPLKDHHLELTLRMMCKSRRVAVSFQEVFDLVGHYYLNKDVVRDALHSLHQASAIIYLPEFPDLIFPEPQLLINFFTALTVYHIKIFSDDCETLTTPLLSFRNKGIVTEDILVAASNIFDETLTPAKMLEIMEKMLMAFKVGDNQYQMPSLLMVPTSQPRSNLRRWLSFSAGSYLLDLISSFPSDITLLLHFSKGFSKPGLFCATICELVSTHHWKLTGTAFRNKFCFTRPNYSGNILLVDSFNSFLIANISPPSSNIFQKSLPMTCSNVRDTLIQAINKATERLGYFQDQPVVAFVCKQHRSTPHAAVYNKFHNQLQCTKDKNVFNSIQEKQKLWLKYPAYEEYQSSEGDVESQGSNPYSTEPHRSADLVSSDSKIPPSDCSKYLLRGDLRLQGTMEEGGAEASNCVDTSAYSHRISLISKPARPFLDEAVDWNSSCGQRELQTIAGLIIRWENLTYYLGLTDEDVITIKYDQEDSQDQTITSLKLWRARNTLGNYNDLLRACCKAGDEHHKVADAICEIVNKKADNQEEQAVKKEEVKKMEVKKEEAKKEEVKKEEVKKEVKKEEVKKEVKKEEVKKEEVKKEEVKKKEEEVKKQEVNKEEVKKQEVNKEEVKKQEVKEEGAATEWSKALLEMFDDLLESSKRSGQGNTETDASIQCEDPTSCSDPPDTNSQPSSKSQVQEASK